MTTTEQHTTEVYHHQIASNVGSITDFILHSSTHSRTNSSENLSDNSKLSNGSSSGSGGGGGGGGVRDDNEQESNTLGNREKLGHRRVDEIGNVTYKRVMVDDLMKSLQIGLNYVIGKHHQPQRQVLIQDFQQVEYQDFPPDGSKSTPSHPYTEFRLKTYAQTAFRFFRNAFGVEPSCFISSLCAKDLRELPNPGASGSIFYITSDDVYIIKTVSKKEAQFLLSLLPGYYMNLTQNPFTLLPKFFGLFCYQSANKNIRFVIMNNLVPTNVKLHEKFDLKGSIYKRKASEEEHKRELPTLKDNDFKSLHPAGLILEPFFYDQFKQTIEADVRFLSSFGIMDYSLLLAVHNITEELKSYQQVPIVSSDEATPTNDNHEQNPLTNTEISMTRIANLPTYVQYLRVIDFIRAQQETSIVNPDVLQSTTDQLADTSSIQTVKPDASPASNEQGNVVIREQNKSPTHPTTSTLSHFNSNTALIGGDSWYHRQSLSRLAMAGIPAVNQKGDLLLLYVGIIDILQDYRLRKKLEHVFKSTLLTREEISVCNPVHYGDRFVRFLTLKVFRKGGSNANTIFSDSQSNTDQITIHSSRILNPSSSYRSQMSDDDDDGSSIVSPSNQLPTIKS